MRATSVKTKAFDGIFASILLIMILALTFGTLSLSAPANYGMHSRDAFEHLDERPDFEALTFEEIPTNAEELKAYAVSLFTMGGTNAKTADAMAAYCSCLMKMSVMGTDNYVDIDASIVKTQDEFFRTDYRLERDMPFVRQLGSLANSIEMIVSERMYTNTSMDFLAYQKVRNSARGENNVPSADWSGDKAEEQREVPVYNSTQEGIFELIAYDITVEAISSAKVEFVEDEQGNYYSVELVLDASYAPLTERVIDTIRTGATDPNAHYETITYDFELWDNGFFKSVNFYEYWTAHAMGVSFLSFSTTSDYAWKFSYDAGDAAPDYFNDCAAMKTALEL